MHNDEKETVFDINNNVGFYDTIHTKRLKSVRMNDALKQLLKVMKRIRRPLLSLPSNEGIEEFCEEKSDNDNGDNIVLKGEQVKKIIIPSEFIDIHTRLEFLLGLILSGQTDTLT